MITRESMASVQGGLRVGARREGTRNKRSGSAWWSYDEKSGSDCARPSECGCKRNMSVTTSRTMEASYDPDRQGLARSSYRRGVSRAALGLL